MKDMLGRGNVVDAAAALEMLISNMPAGDPRKDSVTLEDAPGRVCAEDISSAEDLPSFARSTVDGYAVKAQDTFGATETMPVYLTVFGEILMSEKPGYVLPEDRVSRIPTGGMLPRRCGRSRHV